jgi:hypothetical protein
MYKKGISLGELLHDEHVTLMEEGFDRLKKFENQLIGFESFIASCAELLQGKIRQQDLAGDLFSIFSGKEASVFQFEKKHKALARSDFFLFTLVDLELTNQWVHDFLPYWYALARPILLLDDFRDLEEDRTNGEENTIIEMGDDKNAIEEAYALGMADLKILSEVNEPLANFIGGLLKDSLKYEPVRLLLS